MTIVVDATVVAAALVDTGVDGEWAESIVERSDLVAPELVLVEVTNVLRRLERARSIAAVEATSAHRDLMRLDLELLPFGPFADRVWTLRGNLTSYDAWYVAVAEQLQCPLATLDGRLRRATGPTCEILVPARF